MYGAVLACVLAFYIMKPVAQHGVKMELLH